MAYYSDFQLLGINSHDVYFYPETKNKNKTPSILFLLKLLDYYGIPDFSRNMHS